MSEKYNISGLLESFFEFDKLSRTNTKSSLLLKRGLELYKSLPEAEFVSLYLLNEGTFELEHEITSPAVKVNASVNLFDSLFEKDVVGKTLSYGTIQTFENETGDRAVSIAIPLISSTGAVGLIVLSVKGDGHVYDEELLGVISIISSSFANIVINKRLNNKLKKSLEIQDQKVVSRTIKLTESKQNLFEKFESFRSSISISMPHEVRTPLNQILGFSEYLKDATGDIKSEENQEIFDYIFNAANRLSHLFENYIFYNKLNMVASNIEELQKLKKDVVHSTAPFLENLINSEFLVTERAEDIILELTDAPVAVADLYFKKIVQELFDNCVKYSDPGTPINVTAKIQMGSYFLSFMDEGRGMSPEQIKNIEAFTQFDRSLNEQQGTGLGMAIVARIIDIYNGRLKVDSIVGEGTTVTVELPLAKTTDY
ncbi:MAG: HAMP domain-containing sensor histidine kinase [Verrucomicrobia bacterium]|nr:HAMP domain-containing sensor histidine kinase [Verrucomicrobiota bacterium]